MDNQPPQPPPRPPKKKLKFRPKVPPPPPPPIPSPPNHEVAAGDEAAGKEAEKLMKRFHANLRRDVPKVEKKAQVQVAFGLGAPASTSIRKFGNPKKEKVGSSDGCSAMDESADENDGTLESFSTLSMKQDGACPSTSTLASPSETKEYKEPWDYENTQYPTTLPLRKPYSGDPAILDEIEFGEADKKLATDESTINPASVLGLLEESDEKKMFLFQLPRIPKRSASSKGKQKAEISMPSESKRGPGRCGDFEDLPEGFIGKMLVYKSGAVKLKLGDILYDVAPSTDRIFPEDVMAINTKAKHCCHIGELAEHIVVTPNVNSLLDSLVGLNKSEPK